MSLLAAPSSARRAVTVRRVFAGFLALHGFAHFAGTSDNLRMLDEQATARLLDGTWQTANQAVLGTFALLWAIVGAGFVAAAIFTWHARQPARVTVLAFSAASLVLSITSLWAAVAGAAIDVVLLAVAWRYSNLLGLTVSRRT